MDQGVNKMKVELIYHTPLWVCSRAIRRCWSSEDNSDTRKMQEDIGWVLMEDMTVEDFIEEYGIDPMTLDGHACGPKDRELIHRVGNKNKHKSTLEHLVYTLDIDGISRACLQELARHRMASYSVQSSRYTLSKILKDGVEGCYVPTGITQLDKNVEDALITIDNSSNIPNDKLKYMLPEAMCTSLVWTINARSLQNFLELRSSKSALWEIRELAKNVFNALPSEHKYLFRESMYEEM